MSYANIAFPEFTGVRCLMMPFVQGDPSSVPKQYAPYEEIIASWFFKEGDIGYLTIDESIVQEGTPHRGDRAKYGRALHTEGGVRPDRTYVWGGGGWGSNHDVTLAPNVQILLSNNLSGSCAVWDSECKETSIDGDIGDKAHIYPYTTAHFMAAGEVARIGIFTPHESLPVKQTTKRQFLRIISSGVNGREPYFTQNPLMKGE